MSFVILERELMVPQGAHHMTAACFGTGASQDLWSGDEASHTQRASSGWPQASAQPDDQFQELAWDAPSPPDTASDSLSSLAWETAHYPQVSC